MGVVKGKNDNFFIAHILRESVFLEYAWRTGTVYKEIDFAEELTQDREDLL